MVFGKLFGAVFFANIIRMLAVPVVAGTPMTAILKKAPGGVPIIHAKINGTLDAQFVLDNGASNTTIRPAIALILKLTPEKTDDVVGLSGSQSIPIYRIKKMTFAGVEVRDVMAGGIEGPSFEGFNVAGLLGVDVFGERMVEYDLRKMQFTLYPLEERKPPHGFVEVKAEWNRPWRILVEGLVNGRPILAMIDTGAEHSIVNFSIGKNLPDAFSEDRGSIRGLDGSETNMKLKQIADMEIGIWKFSNIVVGAADLGLFNRFGSPDRSYILLGSDLLNGRAFVIDYTARRIWMRQDNYK